eukprot:TRINITY_DN2390_c0_g2_i1.p1 TRINITY_DN2390_c0_g2~~TRINITY_DN2390_c0_g2_i1.p1  ORF type:complete len:401 (-),score=41.95 TRINITY_DN2390_c0_g2_i1:83-1285(-)
MRSLADKILSAFAKPSGKDGKRDDCEEDAKPREKGKRDDDEEDAKPSGKDDKRAAKASAETDKHTGGPFVVQSDDDEEDEGEKLARIRASDLKHYPSALADVQINEEILFSIYPRSEVLRMVDVAVNANAVNETSKAIFSGRSSRNLEIARRNWYRITSGEWLCDQWVNMYGQVLECTINNDTSTDILLHLVDSCVSQLLATGRAINPKYLPSRLYARSCVFVPLNFAKHWILGVIDFRIPQVVVLDSLYNPKNVEKAKQWMLRILDCMLEQKRSNIPEGIEKRRRAYTPKAPKLIGQRMSIDECGAFTCWYMHAYASLSVKEAEYIHKHTAKLEQPREKWEAWRHTILHSILISDSVINCVEKGVGEKRVRAEAARTRLRKRQKVRQDEADSDGIRSGT